MYELLYCRTKVEYTVAYTIAIQWAVRPLFNGRCYAFKVLLHACLEPQTDTGTQIVYSYEKNLRGYIMLGEISL